MTPLFKLRVGAVSLLAVVAVISAAIILWSTPASAACDPAAANGVTATCTGATTNQGTGASGTSADTNGYGNVSLTDLTVGVLNGATVTGTPFDGIVFSTGAVNNAGAIVAGQRGIFGVSSLVFTNSGSVVGDAGGLVGGTIKGTNSGLIKGAAGIYSSGNVTLTNSGSIVGASSVLYSYLTAPGIYAGALNLTNSGSITGADGINLLGNSTIANSGSITGTFVTVSNPGYGIRLFQIFGDTLSLMNPGTISGINGGIIGTGTTTFNIVNSGSIAATMAGDAVSATIVNLTNSGRVSGQANGVVATNVNVVNSGTIVGATGIRSSGAGIVTNSGTIIGTGGTAVLFGAASDTLNVLPGAQFGGLVNFGGGADRVVFGPGSWILNVANFNAALSTVSTPGTPYFVTPNQIVVTDISGLGAQNRAMMDITGWINSVLPDTPVFAPAPGGGFNAYAAADTAVSPFAAFDSFPADAMAYAKSPVFKAANVTYADGNTVWTKGFGGQRQQDTSGTFVGGTTTGYGGAIGYERLIDPSLRIGGLVGGSTNKTNLNQNAGSTSTDTVFGGVFGRKMWGGTFLDLAVIGGNLDNTAQRTIGGGVLQTATASYGGWFVMPSLVAGQRFDINGRGFTITPALKVRYLDAHLDGYTETGSTVNLTVGARAFEAWEERAELTFANTSVFGVNRVTGRVTVGALAQQRTGGGTISLSLLGQTFLATTPDQRNINGGFGNVGLDWQVGQVTLFASGEAASTNDSTRTYSGKGGARISW